MSKGQQGTCEGRPSASSGEGNRMLRKLRVLAVEEDHIIRRLIRVNLEADGLSVCEASSHHDCVEVARQNDCNLLLLSQEVSEQEALYVVGRVRQEEGWPMPVLLVTSDTPSRSLLIALEPAAHIRKPFDASKLTQCVRDLLSRIKPVGLAVRDDGPVC